MSAMMELDLETLRFRPRGRSVHFVIAERMGGHAVTFCGRSAPETNIDLLKYSAVRVNEWCQPCYENRRKAINS